jgi:hypothetical protein
MEKTITFTMTESQAKKFESLLDEFNATVNRNKESEASREKEMSKIEGETRLLLLQAKQELEKIKQINATREKMIWEQ